MKLVYDPETVLTEEHSAAERRNYTGSFCGFVLLDTASYDLQGLAERLKQRLQIVPQAVGPEEIIVEGGQEGDWLEQLLAEEPLDILTAPDVREDSLLLDIPGAMVAVSFEPSPVPDGEAERIAQNNARWPEAVAVTGRHVAHLMVAVLPQKLAPLEAGKAYVKVVAACLEAANAVAVYTAGTVLEPGAFCEEAAAMEQGRLPLLNWLHVGVYQNEAGNNGYTVGMDAFGKDELEVLGSRHSPEEIRAFLFHVAAYVLKADVTLQRDGILEVPAGQGLFAASAIAPSTQPVLRLSVKRGDGVAVDGHSMQIAY